MNKFEKLRIFQEFIFSSWLLLKKDAVNTAEAVLSIHWLKNELIIMLRIAKWQLPDYHSICSYGIVFSCKENSSFPLNHINNLST